MSTCPPGVHGNAHPPRVQKQRSERSSAGALEELDEDLAEWSLHLVGGLLELGVAHEVGLQQRVELRLVKLPVDLAVEEEIHLVEVGCVEPRCEWHLLDLRIAALLGTGGGRLGGVVRRF
jgi:hypothetical protein